MYIKNRFEFPPLFSNVVCPVGLLGIVGTANIRPKIRIQIKTDINHLSANRRSKYLKTPMTLAASTSMVGLELTDGP